MSNMEDIATIVEETAAKYPGLVDRDWDAIHEIGDVDMESILGGYLIQQILSDMGEMSEDTEDALADAVVDYYCDRWDG